MKLKMAVVMDAIDAVKVDKDSSIAMMISAQARGHSIDYMTQNDLFVRDGQAYGRSQTIVIDENKTPFYTLSEPSIKPLRDFDAILMRKDPPFDTEYIYTTYLLELAKQQGVLVVNDPQSLRDANEKFFTAFFPQCTPPTLISRDQAQLKSFWLEFKDVIFKPLEGMGGKSVFRVGPKDPNVSVILETLTQGQSHFIMAQQFISQIHNTGDKRILLVDGEPIDYALARIPAQGETRGNLAAGAQGKVVPLTPRDRFIAEQLKPSLRQRGLLFVGLDVIGDYLTEINVTSPTCIREIQKETGIDIAAKLIAAIEQKSALHRKSMSI